MHLRRLRIFFSTTAGPMLRPNFGWREFFFLTKWGNIIFSQKGDKCVWFFFNRRNGLQWKSPGDNVQAGEGNVFPLYCWHRHTPPPFPFWGKGDGVCPCQWMMYKIISISWLVYSYIYLSNTKMQDFTSWDIKYYMQVDDPGTQAASSLEDKMSQVSYTQMNEWKLNIYM